MFFKKKSPFLPEHREKAIQEEIEDGRRDGFGAAPENVTDKESLYLDFLDLCSELLECRYKNGGYGKEQICEAGDFVLNGLVQYQSDEFHWDTSMKNVFPRRSSGVLSHLIGWCYYIEENDLNPYDIYVEFQSRLKNEDFPSVQNRNVRPEISEYLDSINYREMPYRDFQDMFDEFLKIRQERENDEVLRYIDFVQSLSKEDQEMESVGIQREFTLTEIIAQTSFSELDEFLKDKGYGLWSQTGFSMEHLFFNKIFPEKMKVYNSHFDFTDFCKKESRELCGDRLDLDEFTYDYMGLTKDELTLYRDTGYSYDEYCDYMDRNPNRGCRPEYLKIKFERKDIDFSLYCEWKHGVSDEVVKRNRLRYDKNKKNRKRKRNYR